jgi:hypothetical protein
VGKEVSELVSSFNRPSEASSGETCVQSSGFTPIHLLCGEDFVAVAVVGELVGDFNRSLAIQHLICVHG